MRELFAGHAIKILGRAAAETSSFKMSFILTASNPKLERFYRVNFINAKVVL